jgi:hypothetical protein
MEKNRSVLSKKFFLSQKVIRKFIIDKMIIRIVYNHVFEQKISLVTLEFVVKSQFPIKKICLPMHGGACFPMQRKFLAYKKS